MAGRKVLIMSSILNIRHTLTVLSANSAVSDRTIKVAEILASENPYKQTSFSCPIFGKHLDYNAAVTLADLLYRSGEDPERLAAIVAGELGNVCVKMQISSLGKNKHQRQSELTFEKNRRPVTRFSIERNMRDEESAIRSIALGIIFGAQSGVRLLFPEKLEDIPKIKNMRAIKRVPCTLECVSMETRETEVYYINISDSDKRKKLEKICRHNRRQEKTEALEVVTFSAYESELVQDIYGERFPGIGNRCLFPGEMRTNSNVIVGAFAAAAWGFLKFELGIGKAELKKRDASLNSWRDKRDIDRRPMLPIMLRDLFMATCQDKLDEFIVNVAMNLGTGYSIEDLKQEIHEQWNYFGGSTPPSHKTVQRRHKRLMEVVKARLNED